MSYNKMEGNQEIKDFLNNIKVDLYDGDNTIDLMDFFPNLKKGIFYIGTFVSLLYLYYHQQKLCNDDLNITLDGPMKRCFGKQPLDVVEVTTLRDLVEIIREKSVYYCDHDEPSIMEEKNMSNYLATKSLTEHFDFYCVMTIMSPDKHIRAQMVSHPKVVKLHYHIIYHDEETIKKCLSNNDPRCHKYCAYTLALKRRNPNIINMTRDSIILRILLHQEILRMFVGENLIKDIYSLMMSSF